MQKHFLKLLDFTPAEIQGMIDLAIDLKEKKRPVSPTAIWRGRMSR